MKILASKHIFARWKTLLPIFDFNIEFTNGSNNSLPDFVYGENLQGHDKGIPLQDLQLISPLKTDLRPNTSLFPSNYYHRLHTQSHIPLKR